ncbi:MAG: hypothetical protein K6F92_09245 [Lachnospiraceae bacterium]|nr:hypothetical protein [Lachnospiraceae bacterium]
MGYVGRDEAVSIAKAFCTKHCYLYLSASDDGKYFTYDMGDGIFMKKSFEDAEKDLQSGDRGIII